MSSYRGRGRGRGRGGYRGRGGGQRGGRGPEGGGDRGGRHPYDPDEQTIHYKLLEAQKTATARDALLFCSKKAFIKLLQDEALERKKDWVDLVLAAIKNALSADESLASYKVGLKTELLGDSIMFLEKTCNTRFVNEMCNDLSMRIDPFIRAMDDYLDVYHHLCAIDPLAYKTMAEPLKKLKLMLKGAVQDEPALQAIYQLVENATAEATRKEAEREILQQRQRLIKRTGRMETEQRPVGDFREIPVHPTKGDMKIAVELRKHKVEGAFSDTNDYLDIQFRLLREDFVSTIRNGVRDYKMHGSRVRSGDVKVYENFTVLSPNFGRHGVTYLIKIDKNQPIFKRMNWAITKRLMYGSLLCLSQDAFEKCYLFATIAERNPEQITKDGVFEIHFLPESQAEFDALPDQGLPFMAIESTAYFEAYLHVLTGMQKLDSVHFAMARYIVRTRTSIHPPEYIKGMNEGYRLIQQDGHVTGHVAVTQLESGDLRASRGYGGTLEHGQYSMYGHTMTGLSADLLGFNQSQYEAFLMALTKEFVVIQGPPGTGKTYVGLKIVETLLYNLYSVPCADPVENSLAPAKKKHSLSSSVDHADERENNCPPQSLQQMLVVCFTNHALDQFLEGMLDFCPISDIIRVGSRSQNVALEPCNIHKQRGRRSRQMHLAHLELNAKRDNFLKENDFEKLKKNMELSRTRLLYHDTYDLFAGHDLLYSQMADYARRLAAQGINPGEAMSRWLECDAACIAAGDTADVTNNDSSADQEVDEVAPDDSVDIVGEVERELENRMNDDDDENSAFLKRLRKSFSSKSAVSGGDALSGFTTVQLTKKQKWKQVKKVQDQLAKRDIMSENEINTLNEWITSKGYDITRDLDVVYRWRLYRFLIMKFQKLLGERFKALQDVYTEIVKLGDDLRKQNDIETLRKAKVIGMTTTGAARMQSVLQQVGPEIVIVEEAAEVLEAHIITALSKHCKHLILIGDHKQLKPNPTVYDLAQIYNLDLSLFERMVNNHLPVKTLNIQHRMRPEVSKYIRGHIYDRLDDHPTVRGRKAIEGVDKPVFFFNHNSPEATDNQMMSHSNEFEAEMVVGLTRYLLRQKTYEPEDITIITMYTGQLLMIKRKMPKAEFQGVKITSVDNFQGEENKILIISLVRSNNEGKLGFVKIENRVCVSLSRAQYGMYVFGNFDMFSKGSELWRKMVDTAKAHNEFGTSLSLSCTRHRNPSLIKEPQDFQSKVPTGGCTRICRRELSCGHCCKMTCHSKDLEHKEYRCTEPCPKELSPCKHKCPRMCSQECQKCIQPMKARLPCQHIRTVRCHEIYEQNTTIPCFEACPEKLSCGHDCSNRCSEPCTSECKVKVEQVCSRCYEVKKIECHVATHRLKSYTTGALAYSYQCDTPCDVTLACGHTCTGSCYACNAEGHKQCIQKCAKVRGCGHGCPRSCHECSSKGSCGQCTSQCPFECSHGMKCRNLCGQKCQFHNKQTDCQWGCEHSKCSKSCGESCDHIPCDKQCQMVRSCTRKGCKEKYQCMCLCGETCINMCPKCDVPKRQKTFKSLITNQQQASFTITPNTLWIQLKDCKHILPAEFMDNIVYSGNMSTVARCPFKGCGKVLYNTPRYVTRTRSYGIRPQPPKRQTVVDKMASLSIGPSAAPRSSWTQTSTNRALKGQLRQMSEQLEERRETQGVSASTYRLNMAGRDHLQPRLGTYNEEEDSTQYFE